MKSFISHKDKVLEAMDAQVLVALEACGLVAEGYAKQALQQQQAVDTGLLRNSVTYAISGQAPAITSYSADTPKKGRARSGIYNGTADDDTNVTLYLGTNVEYAPYIELGTGRHTHGGRQTKFAGGHGNVARPFIKPALADHVEQYKKALEKYLKG
jgi:hypothetical protein